MSQSELLRKVVEVLNTNGIPYMVTGSIVSSLQGEPRSTHDIDIVVNIKDFDTTRFQRRVSEDLFGIPMYVSSPEDTILAKLRWMKLMGGSEKQFGDALNVYEVQYDKLNLEYLDLWANQLEVSDLWRRLKEEGSVI